MTLLSFFSAQCWSFRWRYVNLSIYILTDIAVRIPIITSCLILFTINCNILIHLQIKHFYPTTQKGAKTLKFQVWRQYSAMFDLRSTKGQRQWAKWKTFASYTNYPYSLMMYVCLYEVFWKFSDYKIKNQRIASWAIGSEYYTSFCT